MAKKKLTTADLEARRQMRENAERTRKLAERAVADIERVRGKPIRRPTSNAEWLRELAEKAQAELDRRRQPGT
jgi:hypothetical protein